MFLKLNTEGNNGGFADTGVLVRALDLEETHFPPRGINYFLFS